LQEDGGRDRLKRSPVLLVEERFHDVGVRRLGRIRLRFLADLLTIPLEDAELQAAGLGQPNVMPCANRSAVTTLVPRTTPGSVASAVGSVKGGAS